MSVQLTAAEYEEVRAEARPFALVPGHEDPGVETVVWRTEREARALRMGQFEHGVAGPQSLNAGSTPQRRRKPQPPPFPLKA